MLRSFEIGSLTAGLLLPAVSAHRKYTSSQHFLQVEVELFSLLSAAVVDPTVIIDDPDGNGSGKLFLIRERSESVFFGPVGNKTDFHQDPRHIEISQNSKSSPAYPPVLTASALKKRFLDFKGKQKIIGIKGIAAERGF